MKRSESCLLPSFSHVYVEDDARSYPLCDTILRRFSKAEVISITKYTEVFNRSRQDFRSQKATPKIIIAKERGHFMYPVGDMVPKLGYELFYYTSPVVNCIYDCHYCFLQGMFASANLVVFVNQDDFFAAVERLLENNEKVHLSISYDSDLLALEGVLGLCRDWILFTAKRDKLDLEIRTKSANYAAISDLDVCPRVTLAWTLSPAEAAAKFENGTPTTKARLKNISAALEDGWPVRVCFDPVITVGDWRRSYRELFELIAEQIDISKLKEICIGTFRIGRQQFERIRAQRPSSPILRSGLKKINQSVVCEENLRSNVYRFFNESLSAYLPESQLIFQS